MTAKEAKSWLHIHKELLRRIRDRDYAPGALIPGEVELAAEFGCARTTVNRALRELSEAGLVTRRRRAGTRVAVNPPHKATLTIPIIREEVELRGASYRHVVIGQSVRPVPPQLGAAFPLPAGCDVLYQQALHYADERPFVYEERHTNLATAPGLKDVDFTRISANEWLVQNAPFTGGDMSFHAVNADAELARYFECPPETALFAVDRSTWDTTAPITHVRMIYAPGHRMRMSL